jgi:hypothetical protein
MNGVAMHNKQSPEKPESAPSCYGERLAECRRLLKRIEAGLEQHGVRQAATPEDWTHAGDLGHVAEELANIVAFLGDWATESETQPMEENAR